MSPEQRSPPGPSTSSNATSGFVYPVKSLLSGKIRPGSPLMTSRSLSDENLVSLVEESGRKALTLSSPLGSSSSRDAQIVTPGRDVPQAELHRVADSDALGSPDSPSHRSFSESLGDSPSPNFRHYPAEEHADVAANRKFTSISSALEQQGHSSETALTMEKLSSGLNQSSALGPHIQPRGFAPTKVAAEATRTETPPPSSAGGATITSPPPRLEPFNPSQYGLVHLPPLSDNSTSSPISNRSSSSAYYSSKSHNTDQSNQYNEARNKRINPFLPQLLPQEDTLDNTASSGSIQEVEDAFTPLADSPTTAAASVASTSTLEAHVDDNYHSEASSVNFSEENISASIGQGSSVMSSASVQSSQSHMHTTFRFRHEEDENGNHVVIGREGVLYKCEDEPIRTPGAVQGYGVLIVVEETPETLVVRQVSENSGELLGLPPKFLFSLECFTDTLPESQAGLLWDNIQFLEEPHLDNEKEDISPHVFLLSGFSAPSGDDRLESRSRWSCWCAIHRPQRSHQCKPLIIMEFEFERDVLNPLFPPIDTKLEPSGPASPMGSNTSSDSNGRQLLSEGTPSTTASSAFGDVNPMNLLQPGLGLGGEGADEMTLSAQALMESVTSYSRPIPALERLRRMTRESPSNNARRQGRRAPGPPGAPPPSVVGSSVGMMDVFAVVSQINEQLDDAPNFEHFLKIVVGVIKDLTQFHRVMVYQFDEGWNGMVVSELVDWAQCPELYRGLHFPATDIPAQARALYVINKVRVLYDRAQPTARIVARTEEDLEEPLDMTHCYLRAMSPIHIKYLGNMGVRASMSISIVAFGSLWGLVACHSFGDAGMRVSFPVRQILRLLSQSISRNVERLSYAQRLHSRQLINTMPSDAHPTGYIVSNADDLLSLFDADHGVLVVGDAAKILGPNQHGQETLIVAEYLRLKQFNTIYASQAVVHDFPDLNLSTGLEILAGLLYVPLSSGGRDFIAFLRKGQVRSVRWAGKPNDEAKSNLEPRTSFKQWSEKVAGRSRAWTDEQLETANVLALVYGKFIEVWRQKQDALHTTKLSNLLLSNANHEVRTPLNHIINYLELALNGQLDGDTRDYLSRTHTASKNLLSTINDLLDLTRLESGGETSLMETFNLIDAINEATAMYSQEAERKGLAFNIDVSDCPTLVVGDTKRIMTVVQNLTANAIKFTSSGSVSIVCSKYNEPEGLRGAGQVAVEISISDTGCGIPSDKLECLFREFEQVESSDSPPCQSDGLGLGLAVVARNVAQLHGQLRVESKVDQGSQFAFLIPLSMVGDGSDNSSSSGSSMRSLRLRSRDGSYSSGQESELDALVEALSTDHMRSPSNTSHSSPRVTCSSGSSSSLWSSSNSKLVVADSRTPIRPIRLGETFLDAPLQTSSPSDGSVSDFPIGNFKLPSPPVSRTSSSTGDDQFRILVVEDNDINRIILSKRLRLDKHVVVEATNGREGLDKMQADTEFDLILMDIQMPIMDGFEATEGIRRLEEPLNEGPHRVSRSLNGRIPVFAVSASLKERQRDELVGHGMDGWVLKPIDFKRLRILLKGLTDPSQRARDIYHPGCNWEAGGWFDKSTAASV